jgi:hypothetical protein
LSCGYQLSKAENIMNNFEPSRNICDINEIIEFYNINQYIDAEIYLKSWTTEDIAKYKIIVTEFKRLIGRFFNAVSDDNFKEQFALVDINYKDDFWRLIEKFKCYEKISLETFYDLFEQSHVMLYEILSFKKIVNQYNQAIKNQLLLDESAAELLLDKYEMKKGEIHLPQELSAEDKETIILNYIAGSNPNLNYLRLIVNIQSTAEFTISDRTRLKAKKRAENEENKIFVSKDSGIHTEIIVTFSKNQEEVVKHENNGRRWIFSYDLKWIQNNNDYNTLMNNFIYLFEFVDSQMRFTLVSKLQEMGMFEKHLFLRSRNAYAIGVAFDSKNALSNLQLAGYYQELVRMKIRLEEIIEWFFKKYVVEEFNIVNFKINMPSEHSRYIEKCRAILPEMESILKQFSLFVEDKIIDHELLEMSSGHLLYKDIPSLLDKKYIYGKGDEFKCVTHYLFSDQCMLSYIEKIGNKYKNFFELLMNEVVSMNDYQEYHHGSFKCT